MTGMASIDYNGDSISYYVDDLNYSNTIVGCGFNTGKAYNITFNEDGKIVEIEEVE